MEYLGEGGWSTWERLEYLGGRGWSTWERGVGVPERGGLEYLGDRFLGRKWVHETHLLRGWSTRESGVGVPGRVGLEYLGEWG